MRNKDPLDVLDRHCTLGESDGLWLPTNGVKFVNAQGPKEDTLAINLSWLFKSNSTLFLAPALVVCCCVAQ